MNNSTDESMVIRVSFKLSEKLLYQDIIKECEIIGKSTWMKLAAKEKIERDRINNNMLVNKNYNDNNVSNVRIDSMDELFK